MRNLFYKLLFILIVAASLLITLFWRSDDLAVTVIEPVCTEQQESSSKENVPDTEKVINEKVDNVRDEVNTPPAAAVAGKAEKVVPEVPAPVKNDKKTDIVSVKKTVPEKNSAAIVKENEKTEKTIAVEPLKAEKTVEKTAVKIVPEPKKVIQKTEYVCKWIEDFDPDGHINGVKYVDNWKREGGIIFTPKTHFYLKKDKNASAGSVLVIESRKSSAVFACDLSKEINLNETPILRWRWRVKKLPPFGDGRHKKRDDQAVGIYVGTGTAFNQKAISYRWETETPIGHWGKTVYSNVMNVWFYCLRNKHNGLNVWYEESRNIRQDFLDKYGFVPEKIALVICGNSQNSKSDALAEIDYIGFYKEVKQKGKK